MKIAGWSALVLGWVAAVAVGAEHFEQQTLFRAKEGGYASYRIPAMITTVKGSVLAFCEGRRNSGSDTGEINLLLRRSTDGGLTFAEPQVVWADDANTCGNPCPVVDSSTGVIWLLMSHNLGSDHEKQINGETAKGLAKGTRTVWVTSSQDDGATWAPPREITTDVKKPEWGWYATGPGIGIQIQRGPHKGRLVIPCDYGVRSAKGVGNSHVIYSDDHGATWKLGGEPPEHRFNESQVVELEDGSIMLNMRNIRVDTGQITDRGVAISHDGGETFESARHDAALPEPICQGSILRQAWKSDAGPGRILFSNPASSEKRERMTVRLSTDDGQTWPTSRVVWPGPTAYSCLVNLPGGDVGLLYEAGDKKSYERIDFARFNLDWLTAEQK